MKNFLFAIDDEKIIVKAEDEDCAWSFFDTTEENLDDAPLVDYLGWCTDEVAEELGYEVYEKPIKGLTIKELYAWAQANGCEDMHFVYGDGCSETYWPCTSHPSEYVVSDTEICLFEH